MKKHRKVFLILILVALLGLGGGLTAFFRLRGSPEVEKWGFGETIYIHLVKTERVEQVLYYDGESYYAVRPKNPDNTLLKVSLEVRNTGATMALLVMDEKASYLEDKERNSIRPLDPWKDRTKLEAPVPAKELFAEAFLWGRVDVPKDYQVAGWFIFEVPKKASLTSFVWEVIDNLSIPL